VACEKALTNRAQVSLLRLVGSSGAPFIDFMLSDRTVSPPDYAEHYTEKLALLSLRSSIVPPGRAADSAVGRTRLGHTLTVCASERIGSCAVGHLARLLRIVERVAPSRKVELLLSVGDADTAAVAEMLRRTAAAVRVDARWVRPIEAEARAIFRRILRRDQRPRCGGAGVTGARVSAGRFLAGSVHGAARHSAEELRWARRVECGRTGVLR
jgi:predicted O-linked N-acetylglucosamine transferase (SPINDLY family)